MAAIETDVAAQVAAIPYWYHRIELPDGLVTPGWAPLNPEVYRLPRKLDGLRVLDVGAWDGYWTFEALKRGAREVVAIDDFSDGVGLNVTREDKWKTFDLCRAALGHDHARCSRREMGVYDVTPERLGTFDIVLFFGTLYHLRHPLLALDRLASVCTGRIIVESAVIDDYSVYKGGVGHGYGQDVVMEFYPDDQLGNNQSNWWSPTTTCLAHMLRAAGFKDVTAWKLIDKPERIPQCRGFASGVKA